MQDQFRAYLAEESRVKRNPKFLDPRVHVVLYFIPPTLQGCVRRGTSAALEGAGGGSPRWPRGGGLGGGWVRSLSELDKKFLRSIGSYSNVIPVIGKADTLNEDELKAVKAKVRARRSDARAHL